MSKTHSPEIPETYRLVPMTCRGTDHRAPHPMVGAVADPHGWDMEHLADMTIAADVTGLFIDGCAIEGHLARYASPEKAAVLSEAGSPEELQLKVLTLFGQDVPSALDLFAGRVRIAPDSHARALDETADAEMVAQTRGEAASFFRTLRDANPEAWEMVALHRGWLGEKPLTVIKIANRLGIPRRRVASTLTATDNFIEREWGATGATLALALDGPPVL